MNVLFATRFLSLLFCFDRALIRVNETSHLKMAEDSVNVAKKVRQNMNELIVFILENLRQHRNRLNSTVRLHTFKKKTQNEEVLFLDRGSLIDKMEKVVHVFISRYIIVKQLHEVVMKLSVQCVDLNSDMQKTWLEGVLRNSKTSEETLVAANVHRLIDIQMAFNAMFYSAESLAHTVIEISNLVIAITELTYKKNHQPF